MIRNNYYCLTELQRLFLLILNQFKLLFLLKGSKIIIFFATDMQKLHVGKRNTFE